MNTVTFPLASPRLTSKKTALLAVFFKDSCSSQRSVWPLRVSIATPSSFFSKGLTLPTKWLAGLRFLDVDYTSADGIRGGMQVGRVTKKGWPVKREWWVAGDIVDTGEFPDGIPFIPYH